MKDKTLLILLACLSLFSCVSQKVATNTPRRTTARDIRDPIQDPYFIAFNLTNDQKSQLFSALSIAQLTLEHQYSNSTTLKNSDLCALKNKDCIYKTVQQVMPLMHKNITQDITCFMSENFVNALPNQTRCLFYLKSSGGLNAVTFYLNIIVRWSQGSNPFFAPVEILEVSDYARSARAN